MSEEKNSVPQGRLFSRVYLERNSTVADSPRFRTRVRAYFEQYPWQKREVIARVITQELGIKAPYSGAFFDDADIRDVLDAITLVWRGIDWGTAPRRQWKDNIARALSEEGLPYRVDTEGGVHRAIDTEFDHNRTTAVLALSEARYSAVAGAVESAFNKLGQPHQDLKGAARDMFEAAETLAKLTAETNEGLDSGFVNKRLRPIVDRMYSIDAPTRQTASRMLSSFEDWVNAAHPFRHGHQTEVPVELPEELGILLLSQGASFLRWLSDIDRAGRAT